MLYFAHLLFLTVSNIRNDGVRAIAEALLTNTTLTALCIGGTHVHVQAGGGDTYFTSGNNMSAAGVYPLAEMLKTNNVLLALDLSGLLLDCPIA